MCVYLYKVWIRFCPSQVRWKPCTGRHGGNNREQVSWQVLALELRTTESLQGPLQRQVEVALFQGVPAQNGRYCMKTSPWNCWIAVAVTDIQVNPVQDNPCGLCSWRVMPEFRIFPSNEQTFFIAINLILSETSILCVRYWDWIICHLKSDWDKHNELWEKKKYYHHRYGTHDMTHNS